MPVFINVSPEKSLNTTVKGLKQIIKFATNLILISKCHHRRKK
jgi:hypothetical protein